MAEYNEEIEVDFKVNTEQFNVSSAVEEIQDAENSLSSLDSAFEEEKNNLDSAKESLSDLSEQDLSDIPKEKTIDIDVNGPEDSEIKDAVPDISEDETIDIGVNVKSAEFTEAESALQLLARNRKVEIIVQTRDDGIDDIEDSLSNIYEEFDEKELEISVDDSGVSDTKTELLNIDGYDGNNVTFQASVNEGDAKDELDELERGTGEGRFRQAKIQPVLSEPSVGLFYIDIGKVTSGPRNEERYEAEIHPILKGKEEFREKIGDLARGESEDGRDAPISPEIEPDDVKDARETLNDLAKSQSGDGRDAPITPEIELDDVKEVGNVLRMLAKDRDAEFEPFVPSSEVSNVRSTLAILSRDRTAEISVDLDISDGELAEIVAEIEALESSIKSVNLEAKIDLNSLAIVEEQLQLLTRDRTVDIKLQTELLNKDITGSAADIDSEITKLLDLAQAASLAASAKDEITDSNKELDDAANDTTPSITKEATSFKEALREADSFAEAKQGVKNANEHMSGSIREAVDDLDDEQTNFDDASKGAKTNTEAIESLVKAKSNATKSSNALSDAVRKMRRRTDSSTDSMRAAAQVGELFSEGLGSLSLNLGAFTIALRNFLTQIPLLITTLGAISTLALGAASAIGTLGAAMIALPLAGLFLEAQSLANQFGSIESASEALSVIFQELQEVLVTAVEPITDAASEFTFFRDAVQALGFVVSLLSEGFADLTEGSEALSESLPEGEQVATFQSVMDQLDGSTLENLADSLVLSFRLLGDEIVTAFAFLGDGLANAIRQSSRLVDRINSVESTLSQFGATFSELSELGIKLGSGLAPILEAFSSVVEEVAAAMNQMNAETAGGIVTLLASVAVSNKLAGVFSALVRILPNIVVGFRNITQSAATASGGFAAFKAATIGASTNLGRFLHQIQLLGGLSALATSLNTGDERMREIAFSSRAATNMFQELSDETDKTTDDLRQLAIAADLTEKQLNNIDDVDLKDVDLTDIDSIDADDMSEVDFDGDGLINKDQFLPSRLSGLTPPDLDFGSADISSSPFKAVQDDSEALDIVKDKLRGLGSIASKAVAPHMALVGAYRQFLGSLGNSIGLLKMAITNRGKLIDKIMQTTAVTKITNAMSAARTAALNLETFAINMRTKAQNESIGAALKSIAVKAAQIAANFALAAANFLAGSSALFLAAALAIATGGIILLIGAIGGLAVGIITNFEEIKSSAGDTFGFLKDIINVVVDVLLTLFVESWNVIVTLFASVKAAIQPLIGTLRGLTNVFTKSGESAGESASFMEKLGGVAEVLKKSIKIVGEAFDALIAILGGLFTILSLILNVLLKPLVATFQLLAAVVRAGINRLMKIDQVKSGVQTATDAITEFRDVLQNIPQITENVVNSLISGFNTAGNIISDVSQGMIDFGEMDAVDLTKSGTTKAELADDTEAMQDETEPEGDKTITYNEDNSTNIDQTVNADPEDQAQLSRVVTDAINEANSFERRIQGGSG